MISEGQIFLLRFPQTDLQNGKLRPVLVLRKLPTRYNDWLICMISSRLDQNTAEFDEILTQDNPDFSGSGLKIPSVIRMCRLAVVDSAILLGKIGQIDNSRLLRIKQRLSQWILAS